MKNGYKIRWSAHAITELERTYTYLENNWTEKELRNLSSKLERVLMMISRNPSMFALSDVKNVRKVTIKHLNTIYYRIREEDRIVEVLSFFSNRQDPSKRKF